MELLIKLLVGVPLRLVIWTVRTAWSLAVRHPGRALVVVLLTTVHWSGDQLVMWLLAGLVVWAALTFVSTRRQTAHQPPAVSPVYVGANSHRVDYRDQLTQLSARDRRRFERARRRYERQLAHAGIGNGYRARRARHQNRRGQR